AGGGTAGGASGGTAGGAGGGGVTGCVAPDGGVPQAVTMTFPTTCPTFTACGGNLPGTFFYTSACADDAEFAEVMAAASQCGTGNASISMKAGNVQGC